MITFGKRLALLARYREWLEKRNEEIDRPLGERPENFLAFLDENGLIDEMTVLSFILTKKEEDACDHTTTPSQS